jgi:dienelactone hydrolase
MSSLLLAAVALAADPVKFESTDSATTPERFRLASHDFPVESKPWLTLTQSGVTVSKVTFPSPVTTKHDANNTVHAEYYRPTESAGKRPAVLVLDILDGSARVARSEAVWLAQHGIPALVMYMPYYGPRRPTTERVRMLMPDIEHSTAAVRQTVLDARRAIAWLAIQPGVDAEKLGVVGTSLGSFMAGLVAAAEPRVKSACLLLSGGGLVDAFYDHPQGKQVTNAMRLLGVTKENLAKLIDPIDPLTYARQLSGRRLLFIVASRDDVVPPSAADRLWKATGQQSIVYVDATHVGAAAFVFTGMNAVIEFLQK